MRYCSFIFLFFFSNNILAQKIDYHINILEDSIKIGDSITLISTIIYPENIEIIQPDSSYNFGSLDFIGKKTFPSLKKDNSIYDSTIYFLRTFEIDSILDAKTESFENKERAKLILAQIHDKLNPNNE